MRDLRIVAIVAVCMFSLMWDSRRAIVYGQESGIVGIEYGRTIVVRQIDAPRLLCLTAMSDPVFYASKAYIICWQLDSIEQLNEYLRMQSESGTRKPIEINENNSSLITVDTSQRTRVAIAGIELSWTPGGSTTGSLDFGPLAAKFEVADLEQQKRIPMFSDADFVQLSEYQRVYSLRQGIKKREAVLRAINGRKE